MTDFTDLTREYTEFMDNLQNLLRNKFKHYCEAFFNENPQIKAISWAQYTPHWADGEECIFSVGDLNFWMNTKNFEELKDTVNWAYAADESYETDNKIYYLDELEKHYEKSLVDNCSEFETAIRQIEPFMKKMIGDHIEVMVTKESIFVSDHDHD